MSETTLAERAAQDPMINMIERAPLPQEGGAGGSGESLDRAVAEAMDARQRREIDAVRARLGEQAMPNDPGQAQSGDSWTQAADRASAPLGEARSAVDSQRAMQMAVIVAVMRAQGFSDRSIGRVEPHAGKLYDTFRAAGARVPIPRVFDPKAPSTRLPAPRPAPGRSAEREVERTLYGPEQPLLYEHS
jgi:hypothetical protein